jgi:hypothetical protein
MKMDLLTPLETYCRLILRAKEMEAQVPALDPDEDADNVDDFDDDAEDQSLSVLEDELNTGVEEEMRAMLDDLADDQLAEALALAWVGRGTFDASEWEDAMADANDTELRRGWPERLNSGSHSAAEDAVSLGRHGSGSAPTGRRDSATTQCPSG